MNTATAWILPMTSTVAVAVGEFELIHILPETPTLFPVPQAPDYCRQVLLWQNQLIPVMDLKRRFHFAEQQATIEFEAANHDIFGIVVYRPQDRNGFDYGALVLSAVPFRDEIADDAVCPLPPHHPMPSESVLTCFHLETKNQAIPVLKLEQLFAPLVQHL